jgi:hypothetical protein
MALSENDPTLQQSIQSHATFYRVQWVMSMIAGAGFGLVLVLVPAKPGEELAKLGVGVLAALFFFGGLITRAWSNKTVARVTDLLVRRPRDVKNPTLVTMRRGNNVAGFAIDLTDTDGKTYRLRVQSKSAAEHLLSRGLSLN